MNKLFTAGMTLAFGIVIYKINAWQDRGAIGLVKYFKKRTTAAEYKLLAALNALNRKDKQIEKLIAEVGEARSVARVLWCGKREIPNNEIIVYLEGEFKRIAQERVTQPKEASG